MEKSWDGNLTPPLRRELVEHIEWNPTRTRFFLCRFRGGKPYWLNYESTFTEWVDDSKYIGLEILGTAETAKRS